MALVCGLGAFGTAACGDDSGTGTGGTGGGTGGTGGGTGGTGGGTGGTGGVTNFCDGKGVDFCAENGTDGLAEINTATIGEDTCLSNDCDYLLTTDTFVTGAAEPTLYVEAGTTVFGGDAGSLIITTTGEIQAIGTSDAPIVFTSDNQDGSRQPMDWGGVVLLGNAPLSWGNEPCDGEQGECTANIEGLPATQDRGLYGGNDPAHDCGTLNYVRIEYAGRTIGEDNELNALTLGGCGSETELDYIQAHRGSDDGIEFFGGNAEISHVIVDGTGDDCFDTDQGYQGGFTNAICHHYNPSSGDPRGIEADNFEQNTNAMPASNPEWTYVTIIGSANADRGIVLRRGTRGTVSGAVVVNFPSAGVDLRDDAWASDPGWPESISVRDSCFFNNSPNYPSGTNCGEANESGDCNDNDGSGNYFPENTELPMSALGNLEEDPQLGNVSGATNGGTPDYSVSNPNCAGAFAPSGEDWTTGWTNFDPS
jgi:hypothetical protein